MKTSKAVLKNVWPYQKDAMNLPVQNLETAIPYYETLMGFKVVSRHEHPFKGATLARDTIQIGLAENGGDPTQDGCFFEVNDVEAIFEELKANGYEKEEADFQVQKYGVSYKVFFWLHPTGYVTVLAKKSTYN